MTIIVILFLLASALIVAEVLFPSFGLLSLLALGCYVGATIQAFEFGRTEGYSALLACILFAPLSIVLGFQVLNRTGIGRRLVLAGPRSEDVDGKGEDPRLETYVGQSGKALSDLRPSGVVSFGHDRVDAISEGEFIDAGTQVRCVLAEGNRIIVEPSQDVEN